MYTHARTCKANEETGPKAKVSKSDTDKKITIYLRFSNVKALHTFYEVELQVWPEYSLCMQVRNVYVTH